MAVTVGRTAALAVMDGIHAALYVAALRTILGATVGVYVEVVPQAAAFPRVRARFVTEVPNSAFGRNGKDVTVAVDVYDDLTAYRGPGRLYAVLGQVIALLNPAGNYHAIVVDGYTVVHVDYEQTDDADPELLASKEIGHKVVRFRITIEETGA